MACATTKYNLTLKHNLTFKVSASCAHWQVVEGMDVVMQAQDVRTNADDEPCHPVAVVDCGEIKSTA